MEAFRVKNLRCIKDSGWIDLKPITLLLGENDSGKSTFLRALPLIHQSINRQTRGPIFWAGSWVDFGSFQEAVRTNGDDTSIGFGFKVNGEAIMMDIAHDAETGAAFTSRLTWKDDVSLDVSPAGLCTGFSIDEAAIGQDVKGLLPLNLRAVGRPNRSMGEQAIQDLVFAKKVLSDVLAQINYTAPVRATAERYYRARDFPVNTVDPFGENLAMVLANFSEDELARFSIWTNQHFSFNVLVSRSEGHVSLKIKHHAATRARNLADKGFGFSQLLPILTQLWLLLESYNPASTRFTSDYDGDRVLEKNHGVEIYAIEQPELHLHPRLQAWITDAFLIAVAEAEKLGFQLRLVIETHSEVLINRLGQRIAAGDLDKDHVNVCLFEKDQDDSPANVMVTGFTDEGFLKEWPLGFFEPDLV